MPSNGSRHSASSVGPCTGPVPPPRFSHAEDLPGGHRHFLEPELELTLDKPSPWRSVLGRTGEKLRTKFLLHSAGKGNAPGRTNPRQQSSSGHAQAEATPPALEKVYGKPVRVVGRGAHGTVSIFRRADWADGADPGEKLVAVKEFHQRTDQTYGRYRRRVLAEFQLAAELRHARIVRMADLFESEQSRFYEVMEFCAGGDLCSLVRSAGQLEAAEANCFFQQLMRGVDYLHAAGVAHRDLKPENLLFRADGALKISDFGCSQRFLSADGTVRMLSGICGSTPYIAPEEYTHAEFDGPAVDIWACGVIYVLMRLGHFLWYTADGGDQHYARYVAERRLEEGCPAVESLTPTQCRNIIYCLLDPVPSRRLTAAQFLKSEWSREIAVCSAGR